MITKEAYENLVNTSINAHSKIIAVSKKQPIEKIEKVYTRGQRDFGENYVQELIKKYKHTTKLHDIRWHFIGHLQSNKVKYIAPFISMIHTVDSLKLLKEITKQAQKNDRAIPCLIQIYQGDEESKFGCNDENAEALLQAYCKDDHSKQRAPIHGIMVMSSNVQDLGVREKEFKTSFELFSKRKKQYFSRSNQFTHLSMGMSGDYEIALRCNSTMIRLGSSVFGERK